METAMEKNVLQEGTLVLVNRQYACGKRNQENLVFVQEQYPSIRLEKQAAKSLSNLLRFLNAEDSIVPVSGFRTHEEQKKLYEQSWMENGADFTQRYVAYPGCSEHETGLAIDLGQKKPYIDFIRPEFPYDGICQAFRRHMADYGWIQRYPQEKQHITGIGFEPWHFRYVGTPHAKIIEEHQFVLEEYINFLKNYPWKGPHFKFSNGEIYFVPWEQAVKQPWTEIKSKRTTVSGNNMDGLVVTVWNR